MKGKDVEMSCFRAKHINDCIQKVEGDFFLPIWVYVSGGDRELRVVLECVDQRNGSNVNLIFTGYDAGKYDVEKV